MRTIEICAGGGGQALGLHNSGAEHVALVEIDHHACNTLRYNNREHRLDWGEIYEQDVSYFAKNVAYQFTGDIDLVAGGVPCPPFSKAGQQRGQDDERDLFPTALDIVSTVDPYVVMLENVPGLLESKFDHYRNDIRYSLRELGFKSEWRLIQANEFGVPQLRPRSILIAVKEEFFPLFEWPTPSENPPLSVGEALFDLMNARGWSGARSWAQKASNVAPTIVGGSKKHGGPDLGPTRAKQQWKKLGVNAHRLANEDEVPDVNFSGALLRNGTVRHGYENLPLLTVRMAARLQGFPDNWIFTGPKTHSYRQVGNAFPPPVAEAFGIKIMELVRRIRNN